MISKLTIQLFLFLVLLLLTDITILQGIIISIFILILINFIDNFGKKIVFLDFIALMAVVQWLLGPVIFELLGLKLSVSFNNYYLLAIPSTLSLIIGLYLPTLNYRSKRKKIPKIRDQIKSILSGRHSFSIFLFTIGLICWFLQPYMHPAISFIISLISNLMFVGICFLFFSNFKGKTIFFFIAFLSISFTTLINGMIGTLVFWSFVLISMYTFFNPLRMHFLTKSTLFLLILWFLAILQSSKTQYRIETWKMKIGANGEVTSRRIEQDPSLLANLVFERIINPQKILSLQATYEFAARINQGAVISSAMMYVPKHEPFALGEVTILNTITAFIPRLLWPNKPSIATAEYLERFTGIKLSKYNSVTLGALGDAYVDYYLFAPIFIFLFGIFIGLIYCYFLYGSINDPTRILWFPMVFFVSMTVTEISIPGYINAIFKIVLFIFASRYTLKKVLKTKL